jgi:hypothetical protein
MRFFRFISIAWRLRSHIPWVDEPEWEASDANALRRFLVTKEGKKLRLTMLNMVLKQNQQAVSAKKNLEFEAGFANGVRTAVHTIEALAKDSRGVGRILRKIFTEPIICPSQGSTATDSRLVR